MVLMKDVYVHNCLKRNDFLLLSGLLRLYCHRLLRGRGHVCLFVEVYLWTLPGICIIILTIFLFLRLCRSEAIKKAKSNHFSEEVFKQFEFFYAACSTSTHSAYWNSHLSCVQFLSGCRGCVCGLCSSWWHLITYTSTISFIVMSRSLDS
jgi:hypothetical protein